MQKLFAELKNQLTQSQDSVIVTVVASHGATPRGAGARMLIGKSGRLCGTIGGGAVEYRCEMIAADLFKNPTSQLMHFELNDRDVQNLGMICGGDVSVYFRFVRGDDAHVLNLCNIALDQFREKKETWLVTELTDKAEGNLGLYSEKLGLVGIDAGASQPEFLPNIKGYANHFTFDKKQYYSEQLLSAGYLFIFGGGHVAQELVPVLSHLNFRCIVHEDRDEFLKPTLFPNAFSLRKVDFENIYDVNEITADDYVVIMTRGHAYDQIVQEQALKTPAKYIGVIGSSHKKAKVQENIMSHGFTEEDVARITTPIGLSSVKGETPAEIAISIAGQLVTLRTSGEIIS
jgi:xanthine dehydrogenase accessory factor